MKFWDSIKSFWPSGDQASDRGESGSPTSPSGSGLAAVAARVQASTSSSPPQAPPAVNPNGLVSSDPPAPQKADVYRESSGVSGTDIVGGLKQDNDSSSALPTPLQFENFGKETYGVLTMDSFEGFRLEAVKQVNKNFNLMHSICLGTGVGREGAGGYVYQFAPTLSSDDGRLVLMPRYWSDGTLSTRYFHKWRRNLEAKLTVNSHMTDEQRNMWECGVDYTGRENTMSLKAGWQGMMLWSGTFTQVLSPHLQAGGELTYLPSNGVSVGSLAMRYATNGNKDVFTGLVTRMPEFKQGQPESNHSLKLQYYKKISDRLALTSEFEASPASQESALKFGYEHTFRTARVQGSVDTGGKISMAAMDSNGYGCSGSCDFWRGQYRFGFLMQLAPPEP